VSVVLASRPALLHPASSPATHSNNSGRVLAILSTPAHHAARLFAINLFRSQRKTMKLLPLCSLLIVASAVPLMAVANDFPTTARVEYVLECMKNHAGKYEYLYKCSCAVDSLASQAPFEEYVEISTALRNQNLSGQRGAEFRDPAVVKGMAKKYREMEENAANACFIK
jgi:hypothetical protein